ncbi:MAG: DUF3040 domain-containing protein [Sporichthyaceae bacterium]
MPLSENEQRMLEQMERALYAEDPKFVSSLRGNDLRTHHRRRTLQAVVGFAAGITLLMTGVVSMVWIVGVLGFVLMLASALFAASSYRRVSGSAEPSRSGPAAQAKRKPAKRGVTNRFEDRWRRRRDDGH